MNEHEMSFTLACDDEEPPVLVGVHASGRLESAMFELTMRQTYRNAGDRNLEVVYTFPLPTEAVLLGFATELGGKRMESIVLARRQAERQYEGALEEGDTPVLLEMSGDGLYTANIGNLQPGEQIVLEVRYCQLLRFDQGRLRLRIPTTVSPRYGDPADAGLQPQQVPVASASIEYPLSLSIVVAEPLSRAAIECPTHPVRIESVDGGIALRLTSKAWLDRDVIVLVTPAEPERPLQVRAHDETDPTAPTVLLATLQAPPGRPRGPGNLRLLVDRSGSMAGDSLQSAQRALLGILAALDARDVVSLSGFGSTVEHLQAPTAATPTVVQQLQRQARTLAADLGGTELEKALLEVLSLGPVQREGKTIPVDVLLITDGEVWQINSVLRAAQAAGHRVFAIGVGSAPAEGVLRTLAESTGGAFELATPGESLERAAVRMMNRIRQHPWRNIRVDWGFSPQWQLCTPAAVYGGDTLVAMAGARDIDTSARARIMAKDGAGAQCQLAEFGLACDSSPNALDASATLPRLVAAQRMGSLAGNEASDMALRYQLLGPQTRCIVVHRRADDDKDLEPAELHRVQSMLSAGWGGTGSVAFSTRSEISNACINRLSVPRSARAQPDPLRVSDVDSDVLYSMDVFAEAAGQAESGPADNLRPSPTPARLTLLGLSSLIARHMDAGGTRDDPCDYLDAIDAHPAVAEALAALQALGLTRLSAWLMLAHWVQQQPDAKVDPVARSAVEQRLAGMAPALRESALATVQRTLGDYALDAWMSRRERRLQEAMAGARA